MAVASSVIDIVARTYARTTSGSVECKSLSFCHRFRAAGNQGTEMCMSSESGKFIFSVVTPLGLTLIHLHSSPPMTESSRPGMRRKSSAQNLLSSFKTTNGAANATTVGSISSATSAAYTSSTATVATGREWDGQSVHSDTLSSSATLVGTPVIAQGTSVEYLRDLVQKRIITLTYMRNVHEGCVRSTISLCFETQICPRRSHWFHTIMMSRNELDKAFGNLTMRKRCGQRI